MKTLILASLIAVTAAVLAHRPQPAHACGGCFSPDETITTVDSHRMAISLSLERTILWDQIRYSGDPADFVWVLPVPTPDAQLELADALFFDDLERGTAPSISPPPLPPGPDCPPPPSDGPWGGAAQDAGASSSDAGVDVYREETVGPYETIVIGSENAGALFDWLIAHDYNVPESTRPVIAYYTEIESVFIVLRLAPDEGVDAMQPVRVSYPGYMATFPLKMVTVGAYGTLDLTLWVIAEQRYAAHNYGTVTIDEQKLVWDFAAARSNYTELFRNAIDENGGTAWVAEFADRLDSLWFESWEDAQLAGDGIEYPYLTRLRTSLLVDHIAKDLLLAPSADSSNVSRNLDAPNAINEPPPRQCPDWDNDGEPDNWNDFVQRGNGLGCGSCTVQNGGSWATPLAMLLVLGIVLRRRRQL
jgi:MYXO-CTERM domain-containing protein